MKHGKLAKGFQSMQKLRSHDIIAARDYYYSYVLYEEELLIARGSGYFSRLWDCFAVPRIRRANYGASTVMIAQQMCGINSASPSLVHIRLANSRQSSLSTAQPSSQMLAIRRHKHCTLLWATVRSRLSSQSPRFSSSTRKVEGH